MAQGAALIPDSVTTGCSHVIINRSNHGVIDFSLLRDETVVHYRGEQSNYYLPDNEGLLLHLSALKMMIVA